MAGIRAPSGFLAVLILAGCATTAEIEASKAEAEKARAAAIKVAQSFANYKKESAEEADKLKQELAASKTQLETARAERDRTAADAEALHKEMDQLQRASSEEIAALKTERAAVAAQLDTARADTGRAYEELDAVRRKLQAKEQEASPVIVTTTLVPPPGVEEKLRSLENEVVKNTEERLRLERRKDELEQLLEAARQAEAEAASKPAVPVRFRIVDRLLFDSGEVELRAGGCKLLKPVAERLRQAADHQIRIEGHTDNKPPKPKLQSRYPSNWELSSARAANIVRCLIRDGGLPPERVSAIGYGASHPIASNDTAEGRRRNRRVEIVLFPSISTELAKEPVP